MAQRSIEILVGRLLTDEAFRGEFLVDRAAALAGFRDSGHELTSLEVMAVLSTPPAVWRNAAELIDPRLQKADLSKEHTS